MFPGDDIVIEKDITFSSTCEHHLMPFFGRIAVAYIPDGRSGRTVQAGTGGRGIFASAAIAGTAYRADCGRGDGVSQAQGRTCVV